LQGKNENISFQGIETQNILNNIAAIGVPRCRRWRFDLAENQKSMPKFSLIFFLLSRIPLPLPS